MPDPTPPNEINPVNVERTVTELIHHNPLLKFEAPPLKKVLETWPPQFDFSKLVDGDKICAQIISQAIQLPVINYFNKDGQNLGEIVKPLELVNLIHTINDSIRQPFTDKYHNEANQILCDNLYRGNSLTKIISPLAILMNRHPDIIDKDYFETLIQLTKPDHYVTLDLAGKTGVVNRCLQAGWTALLNLTHDDTKPSQLELPAPLPKIDIHQDTEFKAITDQIPDVFFSQHPRNTVDLLILLKNTMKLPIVDYPQAKAEAGGNGKLLAKLIHLTETEDLASCPDEIYRTDRQRQLDENLLRRNTLSKIEIILGLLRTASNSSIDYSLSKLPEGYEFLTNEEKYEIVRKYLLESLSVINQVKDSPPIHTDKIDPDTLQVVDTAGNAVEKPNTSSDYRNLFLITFRTLALINYYRPKTSNPNLEITESISTVQQNLRSLSQTPPTDHKTWINLYESVIKDYQKLEGVAGRDLSEDLNVDWAFIFENIPGFFQMIDPIKGIIKTELFDQKAEILKLPYHKLLGAFDSLCDQITLHPNKPLTYAYLDFHRELENATSPPKNTTPTPSNPT